MQVAGLDQLGGEHPVLLAAPMQARVSQHPASLSIAGRVGRSNQGPVAQHQVLLPDGQLAEVETYELWS